MEVLSAPQMQPFLWAFIAMMVIAVMELISGAATSHALDAVLPDFAADTPDWLGWLHIGQVPTLILIVAFFGGFGASGSALQGISQALQGAFLPAWLASLPAAFCGFLGMRLFGRMLGRLLARNASTAIAQSEFAGRSARIVQGTARPGLPAQARFTDEHGQDHYVLVEPRAGELPEGSEVVLLEDRGARFICAAKPQLRSLEE